LNNISKEGQGEIL